MFFVVVVDIFVLGTMLPICSEVFLSPERGGTAKLAGVRGQRLYKPGVKVEGQAVFGPPQV